MRSRFRDSMLVVTTATVVAAVLWLAVRPTAGQAPPGAYRAPRTADGKPDLNGIWQALNTANWDIQDHVAQPGPFPFLLGAIGAVPAGQGVVASINTLSGVRNLEKATAEAAKKGK